ncbi:hypothetical protein AQUCO_04400143v1 [Aquilegia coerulea]|uniref:Uncharacterized protein n=1 Tax=Aquilegia coerulea TaxID=218851 RepID=A0A2G5CPI1_AQUCA|nr:hypothetical protein AQUCO_04400143v1 [Aquilegia coerulea]
MMVWVFNENGHSDEWLLKHNICLQSFEKHPLPINLHDHLNFAVLAFHPTSDILFVGNTAGIFYYDRHTRRLETVCTVGRDAMIYFPEYAVYLFSLNLTPLDAMVTSSEEMAD